MTSVLPPFAGGPSEVVSMAVFSPTELDLCVYQKTSRLVVRDEPRLPTDYIFGGILILRLTLLDLNKVFRVKYLVNHHYLSYAL